MNSYSVNKLRNVVLCGHGGAGKTTLVEAMLYLTKATDRLGKVTDGNTICDFDPEEIRRKISIASSVAPVEYNGHKLNIIDTPGFFDFEGGQCEGLSAADSGIIVIHGKGAIEVGAQKAWKKMSRMKLPRMIFISHMDEEGTDFFSIIDQLKELFGPTICPFEIPLTENGVVTGYVNVIDKVAKAYGADGNFTTIPVPVTSANSMENIHTMIYEAIAETSEEMMEKYFNGEEFTHEEIVKSVRDGVEHCNIVPVLCGSAINFNGIFTLMDEIIDCFPSPDEVAPVKATGKNGEMEIKSGSNSPVCAQVFKTIADPFVGRMSFFKVISGVIKADSVYLNPSTDEQEKIGRLYYIRGKRNFETSQVEAGDIGCFTKVNLFGTGDTICLPTDKVMLDKIVFPAPCISMAVFAKEKGDEEKISTGINKLLDEDHTIQLMNNSETHQLILSGLGETHLDVIVSKLKNKFGISVVLSPPRVPYRETIRKKVKVEGKHRKQSGGHGQFGHVWIEFEPGDNEELEFHEKIFGGAVPKNFFPAVEKGLRDSAVKGVLAGYPVVNLKATLVDGSYHPVDSSEMSFKVAASLAYKAGLAQASPTLLEPIGKLSVYVPDDMTGDIMGDVNKRRGRVLGVVATDDLKYQCVEAEVPMAEMHSYATDLRSISRGTGWFTFIFTKYEEAPSIVAQKVIEESKHIVESVG